MAIELKNTAPWKKAIDSISSFISEGNLHFSDSGIFFKAIDPSQVVFVEFELPKAVFEKYSIEPTLVGVDLVELGRIMNRAFPEDKLTMNVTESELLLSFDGETTRNFALPLIDLNEEEINIPETKFDAKIDVNARILKEALKDASLFGSSAVFKIKNSSFTIESQGSSGNVKATVKQAKITSAKIAEKQEKQEKAQEIISKYSLNFLQSIVKEADPDKKILLEMKTDSPMKITYSIGPTNIQFRLAHMIL
ncbi:MAG: proliferating cell nuclear antigen (pcna) [Candidatus ainarchaeum sp.]|nr:proliferating cell nuclear antigen (pcna) [Candidatus ainarchaeum sp.]